MAVGVTEMEKELQLLEIAFNERRFWVARQHLDRIKAMLKKEKN